MNVDLPANVFLAEARLLTRCNDGDSNKKELRIFGHYFGCSPDICSDLWSLLLIHTTYITEKASPFYFLCGLMLLKLYDTEEVLASKARCDPGTFRKWAWYYIFALSDLEQEVVRSFI